MALNRGCLLGDKRKMLIYIIHQMEFHLPVDPQTIYPILIVMVEQVKEGKLFETDKKDSRVLQGFDVIFKEFDEEDRTVLRLILPDPNGKFPGDEGCMAPYSLQLEKLPKMKLSFIVDRFKKEIKKIE